MQVNKTPQHLGLIMDGNGRWAAQKNQPRIFGHRKAETAIQSTLEFCLHKGVSVVTLFAFSTENWQRPSNEVTYIMDLLEEFLSKSLEHLMKNNIRLSWMGWQHRVPLKVRNAFLSVINETQHNKKMTLNLAVDYGAQAEICLAVKKLTKDIVDGIRTLGELDEELFNQYLLTKNLPPLDFIIRTSGEKRLSNFMLWQAAYAELYFCDTLWPDFSQLDLQRAFDEYKKRARRWGGVGGPVHIPSKVSS